MTKFEIYKGDCLKVIPNLHKKYRCIYLDPPFNSKRTYKYSASGDDFGFKDDWEDGEYEKWLDKLIGLCKNVLTENGSLFFHISAELSFIPHKILRKHFLHIEPIFWKKAHGKNTVKRKLGAVMDVLYMAHSPKSIFNLIHIPLDKYYFENSYKNRDEVGEYALGSIKHDKTRRGYMYCIKKDGIIYKAPYGWKISRKRLLELIEKNRIHYAKPKKGTNQGMLYKKLYKSESKGKPLSNLWDDISYITRTTKDLRVYPTQKPIKLLERIIEISTKPGDWVLDPVAGSGTTGVASILLKRKCTLIDINPKAISIAKERLEKITKKPSLF